MGALSNDTGVLYLAFGEQWQRETKRSIRSLRLVSGVPVAVVTDSPWTDGVLPDLFVIRASTQGFAVKPKYILEATPFQNTLFVDTDTIIVRDPAPVFGLLNHYDIGVRFGGAQLNEAPDFIYHAQCNSGVILFRKCEAVADVFRRWTDEYQRACDQFPVQDDARGLGDQRYLAIAIAKSKARPVHLGEYLNFALFETILTHSPVVIVHGRLKDMEIFARQTNDGWDASRDWYARVWLPNIRGFLPRGIRRSDPLLAFAFLGRRVWNDARRLVARFWS